ncbi:unnamed protein product [Peniophora sp. CBMAI 1063]|nr:unnamed protein product [Peniophora sp. CBMAI 1063]
MSTSDAFSEYSSFATRLISIAVEDVDEKTPAQIAERDARMREFLDAFPTDEVKTQADGGDAMMRVEMGVRLFTGYGVPVDKDAARTLWDSVSSDSNLSADDMPAVQRSMLALCAYFQDAYARTGGTSDLLDAARFANVVAGLDSEVIPELGLQEGAKTVAPVALWCAQQLARLVEALPTKAASHLSEDERAAIHAAARELPFLWDVYERRGQAIAKKEVAGEAPSAFECARPGCGRGAEGKEKLLRCGGACTADVKPYYCSRECQKLDWKRHKVVCKASKPAPQKFGASMVAPGLKKAASGGMPNVFASPKVPAQEVGKVGAADDDVD